FVGPDGQPVSRLAVSPRVFVGEGHLFGFLPAEIVPQFTVHTDDDGVASIAGLPLGADVQLEMHDARFAQLGSEDGRRLTAAPVTEAKPIRLAAAASLHGLILYGPTGKPAAGIRVGAQGTGMERGWGEAVTDAEGHYHMRQLRAGAYNV